MLHEILLSLSGQPSPLFDKSTSEGELAKGGFPLLSPPEKALLASIEHLSQLHKFIRSRAAQIAASHPSTICRAASTIITAEHLGNFQRKILDVEEAILTVDSNYVGGYGIVPLSTIVSDFAPWVRRMEWLRDVVQFMLPDDEEDSAANSCTGAALIDRLKRDSQTGYTDLEEMALTLIKAAETAWMRQLSMWILYGQLPPFGRADFFIQEIKVRSDGSRAQSTEYVVRQSLLPSFVSTSTASSILFIGKSLDHIRARGDLLAGAESKASTSHMTLHHDYIQRLSSLPSPLSATGISSTVSDIRVSLSQTVLSRLLPLSRLVEILSVLHGFLLLGRGEFAMALVSFADEYILSRHRRMVPNKSVQTVPQSLELLGIKDGEVSTVLSQAWAELYSLQNEEDPIDDELDLARDLLHLRVKLKDTEQTDADQEGFAGTSVISTAETPFEDLLFGSSTVLSLDVQSPLDLFLSQSDMLIYSRIHAYLLGIRRAQIRLSGLWRCTSIRRVHPTPWGPPLSNKPQGEARLRAGRERERQRCTAMRPIWASCSAALFVVSELGSYFQGEVIGSSWVHFKLWLDGKRPSTTPGNSRPGTAKSKRPESQGENRPQHDPETITIAHRSYLTYITQSLFLTDDPFTRALRDLLTNSDRFISLITQLQTVQRHLDLEADEGVFDSLANHSQDEQRIWSELCHSKAELDNHITDLVSRLKDIDDGRFARGLNMFNYRDKDVPGTGAGDNIQTFTSDGADVYVPCRTAGVDRLLMKLDFGTSKSAPGIFELREDLIT